MKISKIFLLILKKKKIRLSFLLFHDIFVNFSPYYRATFGLKNFLNVPFLKYFYQ